MSKICPKCGREYFGQTETCIRCNCAVIEKSTTNATQQQTGRQTATKINQQRVQQLREEKEIVVQHPVTQTIKKSKTSMLGILAFIFSILGCTFWIGIILAIIDLCHKNGKKKVFSIVSIVICALWIGIGVGAIGNYDFDNGYKTGSLASVSHQKEDNDVDVINIQAETENSETAKSYEEIKQNDYYAESEQEIVREKNNYGDVDNTYDNSHISAQDDTQYNDKLTTGQKNALASAESYLRWSSFSYEGLVKQLEFEKYSHEDAVYAADHCGADWYEQSAKKAKSYLEYSSFSKDGLIEQLEFEGFTYDQAVYGAEQNGY